MTDQTYQDIVCSVLDVSKRLIGDGSKESNAIALFKNISIIQTIRMYDWSFLLMTKTYVNADLITSDAFQKLPYCYALPSDFIKIMYVNGEYNANFSRKGANMYFEVANPTIDYVSKNETLLNNADDDFWTCVAYREAMQIANDFDPSGKAFTKAKNSLQICISTISDSDFYSKRKKNPPPDKYIY